MGGLSDQSRKCGRVTVVNNYQQEEDLHELFGILIDLRSLLGLGRLIAGSRPYRCMYRCAGDDLK
jgi:hypothetical protein